jgi:hypothetical protein
MEREKDDNKNNRTMLIVTLLCAALFGIAVAYAALGTTLDITFDALQQEGLAWSVGFEPGTYTAIATGSSGMSCGEAITTLQTTTVAHTVLNTPRDKCIYGLRIKNTGSVAAKLETITSKTPISVGCDTTTTSRMVCGNITYKLTTDVTGQNLLMENNILIAINGTLDIFLTVEYTGESAGAANVSQANGGFTLNYTQQ